MKNNMNKYKAAQTAIKVLPFAALVLLFGIFLAVVSAKGYRLDMYLQIVFNEGVVLAVVATRRDFDGTVYTIRYFQYDGEGSLKLDNGLGFKPNDRYLLENRKFRLYYTSLCDEAQNFIVVVEDNWGNMTEMEFDFNNAGDEETAVLSSGQGHLGFRRRKP